MKVFLAVVLCLFAARYTDAAAVAAPKGDVVSDGKLWKQIFVEDFNKNVPLHGFNRTTYPNWTVYGPGWNNTSHNGIWDATRTLSVKDGMLDCWFHTEGGIHYSAAILPLLPGHYSHWGHDYNMSQLYGKYEERFIADSTAGYGLVWLLWPDSAAGGKWPAAGEVDFPEGDTDKGVAGHLHYANSLGKNTQHNINVGNNNFTAWHTWGFEWSPSLISYYIDGVKVAVSTTNVPTLPMFYVMQSGANYPNIPATVQGHLYIDYVNIYSYAGVAPTKGPTTAPTTKPTANPTTKPTTKAPTKAATRAPTPAPATWCMNGTSAYQIGNFTAQTGVFSFTVKVHTISNPSNAWLGLSNGKQPDYPAYPVAARLSPGGTIQAKNGKNYAAVSSVIYQAGVVYTLKFTVDVKKMMFNLTSQAGTSAAVYIAINYAFSVNASKIDHFGMYEWSGKTSVWCAPTLVGGAPVVLLQSVAPSNNDTLSSEGVDASSGQEVTVSSDNVQSSSASSSEEPTPTPTTTPSASESASGSESTESTPSPTDPPGEVVDSSDGPKIGDGSEWQHPGVDSSSESTTGSTKGSTTGSASTTSSVENSLVSSSSSSAMLSMMLVSIVAAVVLAV